MKKSLTIIALASSIAISASATETSREARLLRFPATNGTEIVFTYAGDLYTVPVEGGCARRITSRLGYEMFARYSPDGKSIAFTGEYDGNREVYLIPADGGTPKRLTYTATNSRDDLGDRMGPNNITMTWTRDGKNVIYRNRISDGFDGKLWSVPVTGGMPTVLPLPEGGFCSYSPDGKKLAYNRVMREFRTWKYYRGGMADDIWVYDGKTVTDITPGCDAQDIFPMWVGEEIYFASDRDMTMNIFVYNTRTKATSKVTDFHDFDVKFPSTDGNIIVFEQAGYVWKLDPTTKKYAKVSITIASDDVQNRQVRRNVDGRITAASLNPEGTRVAITARGEVFDVPVAAGVTKNVTRSSGSNDREAVWSPDGKSIAYISDITGETEIWLQNAEDYTEKPVQLTKDNDTYIRSLQYSPDGKKLLYTDRKNRIVEVDPATKAKKVVMQNPEAEFYGVQYSPDSKWITYTKPAPNHMSVVYVYELASGKEIPVTEKWYSSSSPVFSQDGKYLIFASERTLNPIYSRIEWNFAYTNMSGVYMAILSADTPSPLLPKDGEAKAADEKKDDTVSVKVDADGLYARIVKLPLKSSGYNYYCDGKKLWYSAGGATNVLDFASGEDSKCCDGIIYDVVAKKALIMRGRNGSVVSFPSAKASTDKTIDLSQMTATIEYDKEWAQIFDEVWRAFRDGFYLENMHGRDWNAIKKQYEQLLPYVRTRLDLNYVIGEMISELACGHAYVSPGEYEKPARISMGLLGAELSKDKKSGFFRIDRILEGAPYSEALRSPLTAPGTGVSKGDYITAIDGVSTADVANIYSLLIGKAGVLTELTVNSSASNGGRKVVVKPIADEYPLYHLEWVLGNIRKVEELSGGKVGYVYIPDMGPAGLEEFARYFYPQTDKEALIVDDRANGGGNISPMIIERLQRQVYRMTMRRTGTAIGTIPDATLTGPKVLLINKYSASDGDLFPWSFKANNLGTVIGTRTWGGIIGISGSLPYMDGTDVRVPFFTNYDAKTGQWIVENHGVDPDILLDNDPIKENAGIDEQLEKAVKVALEQIKDRKALPGVPAPRTFKDLGLPETW